ncbi:MAG: TetR/AcrR family transcriptional regulator [Desulfovibrionaceae bacterium]|nr:TetR/AcrR family transcriptional regulator [Desulfovibrionaceae bacterium]
MIITGKEDLRVQKTIAAINAAFAAMLLESDYGDLSIKELCARAKINKKTFYRYYGTIHDLFREMLEQLSLGYLARVKDLRLPEDLAAINREFFLYAAEQGTLYEKLICHESYTAHGGSMLGGLVRRTWSGSSFFASLDDSRQRLLLAWLHSTGMEMYRQWVLDGRRMPLEDVIAFSGSLLCRGVQGLMDAGKPAA